MGENLGCPECNEMASFDAKVEGHQEKLHYQEVDGDRRIAHAGAVTVTSVDEDSLVCGSCGSTVSLTELVPVSDLG